MTNPKPVSVSELLPCPFPHVAKRGVFLEVDTEDFGFVRGACSDCGCAGPYVTLDSLDGASEDEKHQAATLWNTRAKEQPTTTSVSEEMIEAGVKALRWCREVPESDDEGKARAIYLAMKAAEQPIDYCGIAQEDDVERDISGETVCGFRVAAWRETHPEHGDKYGHSYSEHWSTPSNRDPRVKVERLFTESQLRAALSAMNVDGMREALKPFADAYDECFDEEFDTDTTTIWESCASMLLTVGQLRKARTALETPAKGVGEPSA